MRGSELRLSGSVARLIAFPDPWGDDWDLEAHNREIEDARRRLAPLAEDHRDAFDVVRSFFAGKGPQRFQTHSPAVTLASQARFRTTTIVSRRPDEGVTTLLLNLAVDDATVDDLIHVAHNLTGRIGTAPRQAPEIRVDGIGSLCLDDGATHTLHLEALADVRAFCDAARRSRQPRGSKKWLEISKQQDETELAEQPESFVCVEIRAVSEASAITDASEVTPANLIEHYPGELYGLLTQDEGWRFVPEELAAERLACRWQTRGFLAICSFGRNVFSINLKTEQYVEAQSGNWLRYHGYVEPYFALRSEIAGLDHGPLSVLERCAARRVIGQQVLCHARELLKSTALKELLKEREDLVESLDKIARFEIAELSILEAEVKKNAGVDRLFERIWEQIPVIEANVRHAYEKRITFWVIVLAVASLVVAIVGLEPWISRLFAWL